MEQQLSRGQSLRGTSRRRALTSIAVASLGAAGLAVAGNGRSAAAQMMPSSVDEVIQGWPEMPRMAAREMIAKYGPPAEMTASRLI
jgi:hypothetical protein